MIDIHNHILPGVDDGAGDIEESLAMARIAEQDGIRHIIATPHLLDQSLGRKVITDKAETLNEILLSAGISVRIHPGAEIPVHLLEDDRYRIGLAGSRFLLVEFPVDSIMPMAAELFGWLTQKGYKIIIAHPERNMLAMKSPERMLELLGPDVSTQITAGSLTGKMGKVALSLARYLLKKNQVGYLASDAHNLSDRPPILSDALPIAERCLKQPARTLVDENPRKIWRPANPDIL